MSTAEKLQLGCKVTLLEALPLVLPRIAVEALSSLYEADHRAHGVGLCTSVTVDCIEGDGSKAASVKLAGGSVIPAEIEIVGICVIPAVGPLLTAGAAGGNGVDIDELCRTNLPDIYALGGCAAHANASADGAVMRVESVQNANDMANTVAEEICGDGEPCRRRRGSGRTSTTSGSRPSAVCRPRPGGAAAIRPRARFRWSTSIALT